MRKKLNRQFDLSISLFLASLLTALFIWWNPIHGKYKLGLIDKTKLSKDNIFIYEDLNFDGTSERMHFIKDFIGRPAVLVYEKGRVLFQWNLTGEFVPGEFYHFADYNGNGRKEIFLFTHHNDSIFLDAIDIQTEEKIVKHRYITNYKRYKNRTDFGVYEPQSVDLNADGNKEIIFSFGCAFSHITRKLASYDIKNKELDITGKAACATYRDVVPFDLDEDGEIEFIGTIHSPGNSRFEYPYSDQYSWLMVCDKQMNYKFPPKKIGLYPALLQVKPFRVNGHNCLASFYDHAGKMDSCYLALFDASGELLKKKILDYSTSLHGASFTTYVRNDQYYMALYRNTGIVEIYNDQLNKTDEFDSTPYLGRIRKWDVDADGIDEFLFTGVRRNELIITRKDFSEPAKIKFDVDISNAYCSNEWKDNQLNAFVFQNGINVYRLSYDVDSFYTFRYLIWMGIFLISFLLFYLLGKIYQYYIRRQYEDEKRITALQVRAIEQQMSPHFTLNILNSIGNLYENHDKQKAQYYFGKYSKLLRISLISSGEIAIPLEDELQFTQNYLELERLRLNEGFNFHFIDNQNIPDIKVPKFLIHTFVENAVKHGLFPIHGVREGNIRLNMTEENDQLKITIEDDGVGRIKAKNSHILSTGKGLSILDEILELYKRFERKTIKYQIEDKYQDREETGTRVTISISNN
jgi:hypothetical protein